MQDLKVSVVEILGRPGANRHLAVATPLPGVRVDLAVLDAEPVRAELTLESVIEGVLVTGPVSGVVTCRCARCLTEFETRVELDLCELFATPGHLDGDEDVYRIQGDEVDLEPMLREGITLALPLNPLCREDCKGMCARCGRELNDGACDCSDDSLDPRWAALDSLKAKLGRG